MSETGLVRELMLEATALGARVFRNNSGVGWAGVAQVIRHRCSVVVGPGDVVVRGARPLHAGLCPGSSDLIGWAENGEFLAVEAKTPVGRAQANQIAFLRAVVGAGGIGGICRSIEDLRALLAQPP